MGRGFNVQLIHAAVLAPGEELTERPPRKALSWQEWVSTHADYGLDVNGRELESS